MKNTTKTKSAIKGKLIASCSPTKNGTARLVLIQKQVALPANRA